MYVLVSECSKVPCRQQKIENRSNAQHPDGFVVKIHLYSILLSTDIYRKQRNRQNENRPSAWIVRHAAGGEDTVNSKENQREQERLAQKRIFTNFVHNRKSGETTENQHCSAHQTHVQECVLRTSIKCGEFPCDDRRESCCAVNDSHGNDANR